MSNELSLSVQAITNPDPRCPVVLLLDTSTSMQTDDAIGELNRGLHAFQLSLQEDRLAKRRVEIAVVTFSNSVELIQDWVPAGSFKAPTLGAEGWTPMGAAVAYGVQLVNARKREYKDVGLEYFRPMVVLITDGEPTDEWKSAASQVRDEIARGGLSFCAIGVKKAELAVLRAMTDDVYQLDGLKFGEFFRWLSDSAKSTSAGKGSQTALARRPYGTIPA